MVIAVAVVVSGSQGIAAHLEFMDTVSNPSVSEPTLESLIGVTELSALIGVPVATIYDWRTRGEGPVAYRFGKHLRFAAADVETWIASHRETGETSGPQQKPAPIIETSGSLGLRIQHPQHPRRAIPDALPLTVTPMPGGES